MVPLKVPRRGGGGVDSSGQRSRVRNKGADLFGRRRRRSRGSTGSAGIVCGARDSGGRVDARSGHIYLSHAAGWHRSGDRRVLARARRARISGEGLQLAARGAARAVVEQRDVGSLAWNTASTQ